MNALATVGTLVNGYAREHGFLSQPLGHGQLRLVRGAVGYLVTLDWRGKASVTPLGETSRSVVGKSHLEALRQLLR